jgi:hypothetical protein
MKESRWQASQPVPRPTAMPLLLGTHLLPRDRTSDSLSIEELARAVNPEANTIDQNPESLSTRLVFPASLDLKPTLLEEI